MKSQVPTIRQRWQHLVQLSIRENKRAGEKVVRVIWCAKHKRYEVRDVRDVGLRRAVQ